jgi:AcrR family transcriptional regulator
MELLDRSAPFEDGCQGQIAKVRRRCVVKHHAGCSDTVSRTMARRAARTQPINITLPKGRKSTQRERILNGMIAASNRDGYAGANVTEVITQAGVSRPTFYEYFSDRDACFIAAITDTHERLRLDIETALEGQPPEQATPRAITAIVRFASEEPARAHFLMGESMAGGPLALDARDEGIAELGRIIEGAQRRVEADTSIADIPPRILIGGIYRLLGPRLRRGEPNVAALRDDLLGWAAAYEQPAGECRWRKLKPSTPPPPSPLVSDGPRRPAQRLGPGRPGLPAEEVAANHRERILYAAAQLAESEGYSATTVGDITRLAGIDGRNFYALFLDKQDAFMTLHELGLQQVLNVTAGAFFSGANWPERIWEAVRAFGQFLERNPLITHVGFVEAHAVGPGASQRVHDSYAAFAIFLQEGYLNVTDVPAPSATAVEAIITALFEIVYQQARASAKPKIAGLIGHMVFLCLAPFVGAGEANDFIDAKRDGRAASA